MGSRLSEGQIARLNALSGELRQAGLNLGDWLASLMGDLQAGTPAGTGVSALEKGGVVHQTTLTLAEASVAIADNGATGSGGLKVYDFPAGNILILGTTVDLALTTTIGAAATVAAALGSAAAAADGTLTSTEANAIASEALTFADSAADFKKVNTATLFLDGTSTAAKLHLNFADADDPVGAKAIVATGTIRITWINLGDK